MIKFIIFMTFKVATATLFSLIIVARDQMFDTEIPRIKKRTLTTSEKKDCARVVERIFLADIICEQSFFLQNIQTVSSYSWPSRQLQSVKKFDVQLLATLIGGSAYQVFVLFFLRQRILKLLKIVCQKKGVNLRQKLPCDKTA